MSISEQVALRVERFGEQHIDLLMPIEIEAYPDPWTHGMFRQELTNATSNFFVAYLDDEIVGYCGFWLVLEESHVTKITVAEPWRGRGYGRVLLNFLLETSFARGAETIRLEVREGNLPALRLYESLGFRRVGLRRGYYAKTNETAVVMARHLD
jgi:ribosomal-protein-alanine N-acetyltransferase